jgi:hypothetical protein
MIEMTMGLPVSEEWDQDVRDIVAPLSIATRTVNRTMIATMADIDQFRLAVDRMHRDRHLGRMRWVNVNMRAGMF